MNFNFPFSRTSLLFQDFLLTNNVYEFFKELDVQNMKNRHYLKIKEYFVLS